MSQKVLATAHRLRIHMHPRCAQGLLETIIDLLKQAGQDGAPQSKRQKVEAVDSNVEFPSRFFADDDSMQSQQPNASTHRPISPSRPLAWRPPTPPRGRPSAGGSPPPTAAPGTPIQWAMAPANARPFSHVPTTQAAPGTPQRPLPRGPVPPGPFPALRPVIPASPGPGIPQQTLAPNARAWATNLTAYRGTVTPPKARPTSASTTITRVVELTMPTAESRLCNLERKARELERTLNVSHSAASAQHNTAWCGRLLAAAEGFISQMRTSSIAATCCKMSTVFTVFPNQLNKK